MSGPDVWFHLLSICLAYPMQAMAFVAVLVGLGTVIALCILSPARPTLEEQRLDDAEQLAAVTRPAGLPTTWNRSGGNWWGKP